MAGHKKTLCTDRNLYYEHRQRTLKPEAKGTAQREEREQKRADIKGRKRREDRRGQNEEMNEGRGRGGRRGFCVDNLTRGGGSQMVV